LKPSAENLLDFEAPAPHIPQMRAINLLRSSAEEVEQRGEQRRKALKGGRIVFNNSASAIDCLVRDMSAKGARLEVESVLGVPNEFTLILADGSPPRQCTVRWKRARSIGVAFA
jgi:hypothetical protein